MTKSVLAVARQAVSVAAETLPAYASKFSKKTYTQHQLFALLAVREFLKTDYRGLEQHLRDWSDLRAAIGLRDRIPDHSTIQKAADRLLKKKSTDRLLARTVEVARTRALIPPKPRAAIDATGLESRHASRHYHWRAGKRVRRSSWPKLSAVIDLRSHVFLAAVVTRGPGHDAGQFPEATRSAQRRCPIDTLLGDAAYDAEHLHAQAREGLKIRSTVFPVYRRGSTGRGKTPGGKYRRQMVRRFRKKPKGSRSKRVYGQRWQVESGFSRLKRLLGSALRARRWIAQKREIVLRVITHNLMLLAA